MKCTKNFLKYKYILLVVNNIYLFMKFNISNVKDILQTNLYQGLKLVKVTEEKIKIKDKNIVINAKCLKYII